MATQPSAPAVKTSLPSLRLFLPPSSPRVTRSCFDGAWWPYSDDLDGQAVELARVVGTKWAGRVERMTYDPSVWAPTQRRLAREGPALRLGWFRSREPHEVTLVMLDGRRVELLVVPAATAGHQADWAMRRAVYRGSTMRANEVLRMAESADEHQQSWDGSMSTTARPAAGSGESTTR